MRVPKSVPSKSYEFVRVSSIHSFAVHSGAVILLIKSPIIALSVCDVIVFIKGQWRIKTWKKARMKTCRKCLSYSVEDRSQSENMLHGKVAERQHNRDLELYLATSLNELFT